MSRFANRMDTEAFQVFWAALQRGAFISDAAEQIGSYRKQGSRWVTVSLVLFLTMIPLVPLIFLPRGKVFETTLAGAVDAGRVTPELSAALRDPVVGAAHTYEMLIVAIVLLLMVTKPF